MRQDEKIKQAFNRLHTGIRSETQAKGKKSDQFTKWKRSAKEKRKAKDQIGKSKGKRKEKRSLIKPLDHSNRKG